MDIKGSNYFYKCLLCNFGTNNIREHLKHLNSEKHKSKRELKYIELKFEKKMTDTEIEDKLIELENAD
tara:strand:- start:535 stop:738 length:204 start_codon:yes stop_codon:yes gene_type:complete